MTIVDLNYFYHAKFSDPVDLLKKHFQTSGHFPYLTKQSELHVIKLLHFEGQQTIGGVHFHYLKGKASKLWLPLRLHRYVKNLNPDLIIVHGFVFSIQLLLLSMQTKARIFVQHHGGKKAGLLHLPFFRLIRKFIDGYLFTSADLSDPFLQQGVIKSRAKVFEVLAGSSFFEKKDKFQARKNLGLSQNLILLWVGRLHSNKDPLTILKAFALFLMTEPTAKLYMIFQPGGIESEVRSFIESKPELKNNLVLMGFVENSKLEEWYNAADYFISGSHFESCGFSLSEAMACGCIPLT